MLHHKISVPVGRTFRFFVRRSAYFVKVAVVAFLLVLIPAPTIYSRPAASTQGISIVAPVTLPPPPPIPVNEANVPAPAVSATGVLIKDLASGVILYERYNQQRFAPASTTKIMSALVAMEHYKPEDVLTVQTVITEGRVMGLIQGEKISFESLLYGMLVHSANDGAYTVAENYPGGVAAFVTDMNKKAGNLFLKDTHFTNPIGFDDPAHYTIASDLAKQAIVAMSNPLFAKIVSTRSITVSDTTFTYFHPLTNVNELLGRIPGVAGVKTGYTEEGGEILVSEVRRNGRTVLFVILNSVSRFGETEQLINWVFGNFHWIPIESVIPTIRK